MDATPSLNHAVSALRRGGVVAYPTEAVYGLGCDPNDESAVARLFGLKLRPPTQGVLLIAADFEQIARYIDLARVPSAALAAVQASWPGPYTWVFPSSAAVPGWISGGHIGIALRVTAHPPAVALCRDFGGALVSTSANRHGEAPGRSAAEVLATFGDSLDAIVDGPLGGLERPTPIRDAIGGEILRA